MRGDNHFLALTTSTDEITGEVKPIFGFPIQVCKATDSQSDITFDIAGPSGAPREQKYVDTATGEIIGNDECKRGIRVGDEFREIPQESIDEIAKATKITTMVALGAEDLDYVREQYGDRVTGTYFLQVPSKGGSAKAYRLTYEALLPTGKGKTATPAKAIITKRTAKSRQKLAFIYADAERGCLIMDEVAFASTVREPDQQVRAHLQADVDAAMIEKARQIVGALPQGREALDTAADDALALKADLIEQALAGEAIKAPTPVATTAATDDLEAALEASLAAA